MTTYTANLRGMNFRPIEAQAIVMALDEGYELLLEREPSNAYDPNAIKVIDPLTGQHLGYVAKEVAIDIAQEMDGGFTATCYCDVPAGKATIISISTKPEVSAA
jgi:HIRAN domain